MKTNARFGVYLAAALTLLAVFVLAPGAWAEPLQTRQGQTVPSRTPTQLAGPTVAPTAVIATPRPGDPPPANTPVPPTDVAPGTTAIPVATAAPGIAGTPVPAAGSGSLTLVMVANRSAIWPGANVVFTLTLTNTSAASVRQVRLEDVLPAGLEPDAIQGDATWEGRTLRAQRAVLPPGGRLTVVFAARVAADVPAGGVIVNQAVATAGTGALPSGA